MTDDFSSSSRRQFLGAVVGTAITVGTAGCLGSLTGGSSNLIQPEEPTEPREGSPGEFYYFLEANDIAVDELAREDDELFLTYNSTAETVEESDEEIWLIYEVYKQALIHRGSGIEFLYNEIAEPFDEQALGWGINSDWIHQFDSAEMAANESADADDLLENETADNETASDEAAGNETAGNETAENETAMDGLDMNFVTLWNNIMNSKVYEEDVEAVQEANDADENATAENGTETDD